MRLNNIITKSNVIILILIALLTYLFVSKQRSERMYSDAIGVIKKDSILIEEYEDKIISSREALVITKDNLDLVEKDLEKYKKELNIAKTKSKRVSVVVDTKIKSNGSGTVKVVTDTVYLDTTQVASNTYNRYFNINDGYLIFNGNYSNDSLSYKYTYTDGVLFSIYEKKTGWFKPRVKTVVAKLSNPNGYVTGINSITIEEKKPLLNISLFAGMGMSSDGVSPVIGVGVSKPILRLK